MKLSTKVLLLSAVVWTLLVLACRSTPTPRPPTYDSKLGGASKIPYYMDIFCLEKGEMDPSASAAKSVSRTQPLQEKTCDGKRVVLVHIEEFHGITFWVEPKYILPK